MHLITRGFMRDYTIWSMHGEVGQNVPQGNNDDVIMLGIALHEVVATDYTEPVATNDDVFRNTLADDTEKKDGIS